METRNTQSAEERARIRASIMQRQRRQRLSSPEKAAINARRRQNYKRRRENSLLQDHENTHSTTATRRVHFHEGSTSHAQPTNLNDTPELRNNANLTSHIHEQMVAGTGRLTPLPQFSFNSTTNNFLQGSTSYSLPDAQYSQSIGDIPYNEDDDSDDNHTTAHLPPIDTRDLHNIARNFHECQGIQPLQLKEPTICCYCQALLFEGEKLTFCCNNGKFLLPAIPVPPQLLSLFVAQTPEGRHFRQNIRMYNHVFSFTSSGVTLDQDFATTAGVYTFRAHGQIMHRIGSLLPNPGCRPRYIQMFIYDTDHETQYRLQERHELDTRLLEKIKTILDVHNPFVKQLRQLARRPDLPTCQLLIKERPPTDRQYTLPTTSQVAAIIATNEDLNLATNRDIVVQTIGGHLIQIKEFAGYYDPLQYPLFNGYGTYGWDINSRTIQGNKITCCAYYGYMLQIRENPSILLHGGRLLHQYVVDNHIKIETQRLTYLRQHQHIIRAEMYQGLQDCLYSGETDAANVGRRTVLPSSFTGSPRDMYQRYQDAMAVVRCKGKPDIFLTMTCNPNWKEIREHLLPGQIPQDRPDLLTRVFRAKYEKLKRYIYARGVLGRNVGHVHVVEFQKRGLPHVHMLLILDENDKLGSPDDYDSIVSAEIPDKNEQPLLYDAVLKHMIHGPCGLMNQAAPCMKRGQPCKKNYPKQFQARTIQGQDSYPLYRRRNDNRSIALDSHGEKIIDNRWVVPYNPWLLLKFDCHINVEICSSIKSIKYLYKYIHKGPDCAEIQVRGAHNNDEITKYINGRWICAPEAFWKIFKFPLSRIYPSVTRLQLHLPNMQQVHYHDHQQISDVLGDERNVKTMLTEFFRIYEEGLEINVYLYHEFPRYYWWDKKQKIWHKRKTMKKVIGRLYAANPVEGERFYLRMLLNHVRGPKSFEYLLTVHGVRCATFREAAEKLGILEEDDSIRLCLAEARTERFPAALRRLFVTILIFCEPVGVRRLWDDNYPYMIEDYHGSKDPNNAFVRNRLLHDINNLLSQHGKNLKDFDLPGISPEYQHINMGNTLIEEKMMIPISQVDISSISKLNTTQMRAFSSIREAISVKRSAVVFVDGPGGTGKTFLYRALLASCRKDGLMVLATATSGIAANQLPGGRTAHSRLKIPIKLHSQSLCNISKQSDLCKLIYHSSAIIWDEAPMAHKDAIETVDRTLRDLLGVDLPFGGKVMIFGGDFRQVVPVVVGGNRSQNIQASIVESYIWPSVEVIKLEQNIRALHDPQFSDFVLRVGNGEQHASEDDMINIPSSMVILWENDSSVDELVASIFPELESHLYDTTYMMNRAIITPLNQDVNKLNDKVLQLLSSDDEFTYYSFDSVVDDDHNLFLPEFLNSLSPGNLPPHKLTLKRGCPIMLLRNLDPTLGLCNGTRLLCRTFGRHFIDAEILVGQHKGTRFFLPHIPLKTSEDAKLPFEMTRKQFPVRLSYALTINKSQGQTIPHVGIYLPDHVFSHGQLYVAMSRGVAESTTKVLVKKGTVDGKEGVFTKNIVYKELFSKLGYTHS